MAAVPVVADPSVAKVVSSESETIVGDQMRDVLLHDHRMGYMDGVGLGHWNGNFVDDGDLYGVRHRSVDMDGNVLFNIDRHLAVDEHWYMLLHGHWHLDGIMHGFLNDHWMGNGDVLSQSHCLADSEIRTTPAIRIKSIVQSAPVAVSQIEQSSFAMFFLSGSSFRPLGGFLFCRFRLLFNSSTGGQGQTHTQHNKDLEILIRE